MTDAQPFLEELLVFKKQQATQLFGPWDVKDEGRIAVKHVRPLLMSVFPEAANAPPYLTLDRVKKAYECVTHHPYHAPLSMVTAPSATQHTRRPRDPMNVGPTLNELHRIIDTLASSDEVPNATTAVVGLSSPVQKDSLKWSMQAATAQERFLPLSGSWTMRSVVGQEEVVAEDGHRDASGPLCAKPSAASRLRLLRGSIEQIYRTFCAACIGAGEPVPAVLPIDTWHLQRLTWNVSVQPLQFGESYALHRLFAAVESPIKDELTKKEETISYISSDAFVSLLCVL